MEVQVPPVRAKSQGTELGQNTKQRPEPTGENFDFFRTLMEDNRPPPGIGATNKDWWFPREF